MEANPQLLSADSGYAKRRKQHLALINQLRAIGAQADLDLPRVAVIGNQSAGKSSLVEAISGITVPRDAGTCTRCPMECRLSSSSGPWTCQVSIRWEFDKDGSPKDEVHEVPFGGVITSKADVELTLRRAQAAVLNPNISPSKYLTLSVENLKTHPTNELQFSRNVVCVDLSGPELTDLAFIDLPGIIQNADSEIVRLVEELVLSHIRGNCLILVTLPMSDDIENQKAARLAKQVDPSGLRTIGVMTKPDTLTAGATKSRDLWLDVIEGRRFPLRHGYYCTRQPDDEERANGITPSQARSAEQDFFSKTSPWSRSTRPQQFGTNNLIANLSKLLSQVIDDALPKLQGEVSKQLTACTHRLSSLPPLVSTEPSAYVLGMVTTFCQEVRLYIQGDSRAASLVQENRQTYAAYKCDIRSTAPQFLPFPSASESDTNPTEYLDLEDDPYDDEDSSFLGPPSIELHGHMYLEDLKSHIEKSLTRELPGNVPYSAKTALIQASQTSWEMDSRKCFDAVVKSLELTLLRLVQSNFERYDNLKSRLIHSALELLRTRYNDAWILIASLLRFELSPYTQNGHYLQQTKDKYLAKYKDARAGRTDMPEPPKKRKKPASIASAENSNQASDSIFNFGAMSNTPAFAAFGVPSLGALAKPQASNISTPSTPRPKAPMKGRKQASPPSKATASSPSPSSTAARQSTTAPSNPSPYPPDDLSPAPNRNDSAKQSNKRALDLSDAELTQIRNRISADLASIGIPGVTATDLGKLNPPDIYEREMEVMAEVRAYFHVSYKRVIDNIPMTIDNEFLFAFAQSLQPFLIEKLGLGSPTASARCAAYLAEDPVVVAEREELTGRKKRLEAVQVELYNFGL